MNRYIKLLFSILVLVTLVLIGFVIFKDQIGSVNIPRSAERDSVVQGDISLAGITVPTGFKLSVFADNVPSARVIEFDPRGRLLISETKEGKIVSIADLDNDGSAEAQSTVAAGLKNPHGLALRCSDICDLYVAESNQITRFAYNPRNASVSKKEKLMDLNYASSDRHFTRTLLFLPSPEEDTLLISVGSSCNVCNERDDQRGRILFYNVKTGEQGVYASGLRNAVFMAPHPVTGAVWATEMGRDGLGDNIPPDELNIIEKGKSYGWPVCYGKNVRDADFDKESKNCNGFIPSTVDLQAHSAPLGISFIPEEGWPESYWYDALVAFHGSWNRSYPTGYKIVRVKIDASGKLDPESVQDFITGWLTSDGDKIGRPADVKALPGGVVYISDDESGRIYRLTRVQ